MVVGHHTLQPLQDRDPLGHSRRCRGAGQVRILVVDDDAPFLGMVVAALEEDGHTVITAPEGRAALAKARHLAPDAIILDIRMPGMDGPAFARAYARGRGPRAPIVVVSGYPGSRAEIESAAAHLTKPFEIDRLLEVLRQLAPPLPSATVVVLQEPQVP
jgi:CheY-like chemotaxis protein